jgi:lysozyme family protein
VADFGLAFEYMMSNEEYDPLDPRYGKVYTDNDGGLVRFGINSNSLGKDLLTTTYYKDMPNAEAIKECYFLYNVRVWNPILGSEIVSQKMASKIFDMAVNSGIEEATRLTQRACRVHIDGMMGPVTVGALNAMNELYILNEIVFWDLWFVQQVIKNHPKYKSDEKDWNERAKKLPQ